MLRFFAAECAIALLFMAFPPEVTAGRDVHPDWREANTPLADVIAANSKGAAVLRAQILLDRAGFSPGEIDAAYGPNFRAAFQGFQRAHHLDITENLGPETWSLLNMDSAEALTSYEISASDVKGPFRPVPRNIMQQAKLHALGYQSPLELLGEKFHVRPRLLVLLNPGKRFNRAGERIVVPNVRDNITAGTKAASVVVRKSDQTVSALDANGEVIAQFPATMGSVHDPLPIGKWKITGIGRNPIFHYNPQLFWDANPKTSKARIPPGPNNPVGVVWMDLSKPHYGIHGTPEPSLVGHAQSHGCIRLTNWDAVRLASLVTPGVPAMLTE
jgi:lipoprotein-anchoring transpeptidase ErfK/SrfK